MSDLPHGFLRAESKWLEEPDERDAEAEQAAYDNYCQEQYEYWRDQDMIAEAQE